MDEFSRNVFVGFLPRIERYRSKLYVKWQLWCSSFARWTVFSKNFQPTHFMIFIHFIYGVGFRSFFWKNIKRVRQGQGWKLKKLSNQRKSIFPLFPEKRVTYKRSVLKRKISNSIHRDFSRNRKKLEKPVVLIKMSHGYKDE